LSVAVIVIQALIVLTWQQQQQQQQLLLLCHNCGGGIRMMPSYRKDARHFPITVQSTVSHDFRHVIRLSMNNKRHYWIHNRQMKRQGIDDGNKENHHHRPEYKSVTPLPE
jgi:hypothetical protein